MARICLRVDDVLSSKARPALLQAVGESPPGGPSSGVDELRPGRAALELVNAVHHEPGLTLIEADICTA